MVEHLELHLFGQALENRWYEPIVEVDRHVMIERILVLEARIHDVGVRLFAMLDHVVDMHVRLLLVREL